MPNRSRMEPPQFRAEKTLRALDAIDTDRDATERLPTTNTLWRQIDRWVNEGGALGDGTGPTAPKGI